MCQDVVFQTSYLNDLHFRNCKCGGGRKQYCWTRLLYLPGIFHNLYPPSHEQYFDTHQQSLTQFFFNFPAKFEYLHHFSIFVKFGLARGFLLQALQCSVILIILFITVVTNISIVLNIRNSEIKRRIVSFVLIKNLCIVDTVGAMLILPVPLAATFRGDLSNCDLDAAQIVPAMSPRGSTFY